MKNRFFLAITVLVSIVLAAASCSKDGLNLQNETRAVLRDSSLIKAPIVPPVEDWRYIKHWHSEDSLHARFGRYEDDILKQTKDTAKYVGPITVEMYKADTVEVAVKGFNPGETSVVEKTSGEYNSKGLKETRKVFTHDLGMRTVRLIAIYNEAKIVFRGKEFIPDERPVDIKYTGAEEVDPRYFRENDSWKYYEGKFSYRLTADEDVDKPYTGYYFQKIAKEPTPPDVIKSDVISNKRGGGRWTVVIGKFRNGEHIAGSDSTIIWPLKDPSVEMYNRYLSDATEPAIKSVWFRQNGGISYTGYKEGIRTATKGYLHDLDIRSNLPVVVSWEDGYMTPWGLSIYSPDINVDLTYSEKNVSMKDDGDDDDYRYYLGTLKYNLVVDGNTTTEQGTQRIRVIKSDVIEEGDEGYEYTKYEGGNPTEYHSWKNLRHKGDTKWETFEFYSDINYTQPADAVEHMANFDISEKSWSKSNASDGSRTVKSGEGKITATRWSVTGKSGFNGTNANNEAKEYPKNFGISGESATLSVWGKTFTMPTPELKSFDKIGFNTSDVPDNDGYECKLNLINVQGKLGEGSKAATINLRASTELRVKKAEEEVIYEQHVSFGLKPINETTAYSYEIYKLISSTRGYISTEERGINLSRWGEPDEEAEFLVPSFYNPNGYTTTVADLQEGSYVPSGDFKIRTDSRKVTMKLQDVPRNVKLLYQRAQVRIKNANGTYSYVDMPYVYFDDPKCTNVVSSSLTKAKEGTTEYDRKLYVFTLSTMARASQTGTQFIDTPQSFYSKAILKVAKEQKRETPDWLGKGKKGTYTRVQKATGEDFIDMFSYEYENGQVLVPNGDKTKMIIFAFTDANAAKYGVEKCVKGSAYSAVFKSGWIPAKIENPDGDWSWWKYVGQGKIHSVQRSDAIKIGIGKEYKPLPTHQHSEVLEDGTIVIHYSKGNQTLTEKDKVSLK